MNLKQLTYNQALTIGAELWVLPKKNQSPWLGQIDWLCNFLYRKWEIHSPALIDPELKAIINEEELELGSFETSRNAPVLLATRAYLPNLSSVILDGEQVDKWSEQIINTLNKINPKSVRLFLPANISFSSFEKSWHISLKKLNPSKFQFMEVEVIGDFSKK